MKTQPVEIVRRFLQLPVCKKTLSKIVAGDVTLIAPDGVLPSQVSRLPGLDDCKTDVLDAAVALLHCSTTRRVTVSSIFGAGANVAAFGTVTEVMCSGEDVATPFSLWIKVSHGRITYIQYLDGDSRADTLRKSKEA